MNQALDEQIIQALRAKPGQTAAELARGLGCDRSAVNRRLYGSLRGRVEQDRSYRWRLAGSAPHPGNGEAESAAERTANTELAKLACYCLACLGFDDAGVSTFLTARFGEPHYAELATLPGSPTALDDSLAARQLLGRTRTDRARYALYFGYPTSIAHIRSRQSSWEGLMVEPILLFPLEPDPDTGRLTLDLGSPIVNQKPLRAFTNAESDMIMNELVQLERELGLGTDGEPPKLDELALRLQAVREEWPWREPIDPGALSAAQCPISEITEPGIYNRAVLILAEKSPYTQGLEQELRDLARLPEAAYRDNALGRWLNQHDAIEEATAAPAPIPLLEVLPMNSEQREAVRAALTRPVTVITGPPGTGKSQVVTNLLINAAWMGKRVLVASKNNKAVDVVETRMNALGPRPTLLRVGARAYQIRLAEYVLALVAATSTPSEREDFEESKAIHDRLLQEFQALEDESRRLISLRNDVDRLEQLAEEARHRLPPEIFVQATEIDLAAIERVAAGLSVAADAADRAKAAFFSRLMWPLTRKGRFRRLSDAVQSAASTLRLIGLEVGQGRADDAYVERIREVCAAARARARDVAAVARYRTALRRLQQARPLEEIARQQAALQERIARASQQLWNLWLQIQPSRLLADRRKQLGQYAAILKMVIEAGPEGELSKSVWDEYRKLLREVAPLLPCWAVTSLSARGRIEFSPGAYDIVVFDEASQCDIASALPLLYRAKSVVVIGDPNQLSHISGLPRGQDQVLMEKHGLFPHFAEWAYSHQSLFALAATKVAAGDIVTLVDHHRSHADIINFSNKEFYGGRLRVATRYDRLKRPMKDQPGIIWIDVKGRAERPPTGGAVNIGEARAVVETLRHLMLSEKYAGTVGVVTPFRAQANAITEAVNADAALSDALMQAEFLADTVHKFQGDERDVMIFSPVVASGMPDSAISFLLSNPKLFNVAITRARAQLIVVGDQEMCAKSDIGYLSRFAKYTAALNKKQVDDLDDRIIQLEPEYPSVARPELVSEWERVLYKALYRAGIRPIPQYPVEKYVLDFVVVADGRRLAIEVDGEHYHRNWTGELCRRDQIRNQRLFELGYDVRRFWVYEVRDDLERCVRVVEEWLRQKP
jgi:very-short-patch-repair endonuclease